MVIHCESESLECLFIAFRKLHQAVWDTSLRYSHNTADSADAEAVTVMEEVLVTWDDSVGMLVMQSGYAYQFDGQGPIYAHIPAECWYFWYLILKHIQGKTYLVRLVVDFL